MGALDLLARHGRHDGTRRAKIERGDAIREQVNSRVARDSQVEGAHQSDAIYRSVLRMQERTGMPGERWLELRKVATVEWLRRGADTGDADIKVAGRGDEFEDAVAVEGDDDAGTIEQAGEEIGIGVAGLNRDRMDEGREALQGWPEDSRRGARGGSRSSLVDDEHTNVALSGGEGGGESRNAPTDDQEIDRAGHGTVRWAGHLAANEVIEAISSRGVARGTGGAAPPRETSETRRAYGGQTRTGDCTMLATIFMIGLFALAGLFLFKLVFGLGFGLLGWLIGFAIKALIFGAVIYLVIRIFSPETARRLRAKFSGTAY